MIACLIAGDAISLLMAGIIAVLLKQLPHDTLQGFNPYLSLITLLPVFLLVYAAIGLYSGISLGSPEELRRLTLSLRHRVAFSWRRNVSVPRHRKRIHVDHGRSTGSRCHIRSADPRRLRLKFANVGWWGYPTVVFGDPKNTESIIRNLVDEPGLGLKPIGFFSPSGVRQTLHGVPAIGASELADLASRIDGPAYAVLTAAEASREELKAAIESHRRHFSHILVIPEFSGFSCLWVNPKNLGGLLGLEVYQQVFVPSRRILKRTIDLVLTLSFGIVLAPVMLLVALAIRLDSPGARFCTSHRRIGRGGQRVQRMEVPLE